VTPRIRILHLEPQCYPTEALDRLRAVGALDLLDEPERDALLRQLDACSYDAIFVRLGCSVDRAIFDRQPRLRYVVTPTTGLNHIDLAETERRGIQVISLAGEAAFLDTIRSTAEHTWGLLLTLVRRIPILTTEVQSGTWQRSGRMADELDGSALGIVGYGRLGRMVAGYGHAFGMRVIAYDRDPSVQGVDARVEWSTLDGLLQAADVVSLHITGSIENFQFFDAERFALMKPGALLINTSRGEVVDETALLAVLESGHLGGAALDVLAGDSGWPGRAPHRHPLIDYARTHDNLLITPHSGGYGRSSIYRTREFVLHRFLESLSTETQATNRSPHLPVTR
jgi:D-3-phosphoglycerate dehydrogenase / 2-oxoglutarate reductase